MDKSIYSKKYQTVISLLKQARLDAGITQQDLAIKLKVTQTFVSKCERLERRLDIIEMGNFCNAIGIKLSDFILVLEKKNVIK